MDLCFQIVLVEGNTDKRGKVINIFPSDDVGTYDAGAPTGSQYSFNETISSPRTGFVFVMGVPESVVQKRFLEPEYDESGDMTHEWLYGFRPTVLGTGARDQLLTTKQLTLSWNIFRDCLLHRKLNRTVVDGDVTSG
jgi:hypothetical protein